MLLLTRLLFQLMKSLMGLLISSYLEEQEGDPENDEEGEDLDSAFLDAVSNKVSTNRKQLKVTLHTNGRRV